MSEAKPPIYWNYRVLHDGEKYWIAEVYYDRSNTPDSYTEPVSGSIQFDRLEDMQTSFRLMSFALDRPVLRVDRSGKLSEDLSFKAGV